MIFKNQIVDLYYDSMLLWLQEFCQPPQYFFTDVGKTLDHYCQAYENLILIGDFNCEIDDDAISDFVDN